MPADVIFTKKKKAILFVTFGLRLSKKKNRKLFAKCENVTGEVIAGIVNSKSGIRQR